MLDTENTARVKRNEEDIQNLWQAVDEIKRILAYRLPLWAVFLMSGLTGVCGWLLHYGLTAAKMAVMMAK